VAKPSTPHAQVLDPSRFAPGNRRRLSAPAIRTFVAIADLWQLTTRERLLILGLPSRSTYYRWVKTAREQKEMMLTLDVLLRISAILGIHRALETLFNEREGIAWLRQQHASTVFAGRAPLVWIVSGPQDGLITVRRYLDAACVGMHMPPNDVDEDFTPYTDDEIVFLSATS